jgi:transglutaminase-like putative cysteine protease
MKIWLMLIFLITPLRQVENIHFCFSSQQHQIFPNYSNSNFSQKIYYRNGKTFSEMKNLNFFDLNLNFRLFLNHDYVQTQDAEVQKVLANLPVDSMTLREFLENVGDFLKKHIRYCDENLPQDTLSVLINRKANCIGYSNLFHTLLKSVGIQNKFVRGFYLKKTNGNTWVPVPHRWIEISLTNGYKYFYDPQYQDFSANYVMVKDEVAMTSIKKFRVLLIKKSMEVINR